MSSTAQLQPFGISSPGCCVEPPVPVPELPPVSGQLSPRQSFQQSRSCCCRRCRGRSRCFRRCRRRRCRRAGALPPAPGPLSPVPGSDGAAAAGVPPAGCRPAQYRCRPCRARPIRRCRSLRRCPSCHRARRCRSYPRFQSCRRGRPHPSRRPRRSNAAATARAARAAAVHLRIGAGRRGQAEEVQHLGFLIHHRVVGAGAVHASYTCWPQEFFQNCRLNVYDEPAGL